MHFHLSGSHGCIFNDAILAHDILNSSCMHPWGHLHRVAYVLLAESRYFMYGTVY